MQPSERYPTPDPHDPLAPLTALRNKTAGSPRRRSTTGPASMETASSRVASPTSFIFRVEPPPLVDEMGYRQPSKSVSLPGSPRSLPSPISSNASTSSRVEGHHHRSASRLGGPSSFRPVSYDKDHAKPTPVVGPRDRAATIQAPKSKTRGLSRLFLGTKRPSTSTGIPDNKDRATIGRLAASTFKRRYASNWQTGIPNHLQDQASRTCHQKLATSNAAKRAISPPIVSSLVWESQATGRQFIPIASSPLLNNAISVEKRDPTPAVEAGPLDTQAADASVTSVVHGRLPENDVPAIHIKSRTAGPSSLCSPPAPRTHSPMLGDSGVGLHQASVTSEDSIELAPPRGQLRRRASSLLTPIQTMTRPSTSTTTSSYIEIFSTPASSPVDDSFRTIVAPTPPRSPRVPATPRSHPPDSAHLSPSPLMTATTPQTASTTKAQCMCTTTIPVPQPPQEEWALPTKAQLAYAASLPIFKNDGTPIQFGTLFAEQRTIVLFLRHFFCPMCQDYVSSLASLVKQPILREAGTLCDFNEVDATVPLIDGEDIEGLLPKQVQLVLISCGKPLLVDRYREIFKVPFRMYTDPELQVYEALGMGKMKLGSEENGDGGAGGVSEAANMEGVDRVEVRPSHPSMTTKEEGTNSDLNWEYRGTNGEYVKHGLMGGIAMVVMRALKVGMPVWENGGDIAQLGGEFVLGPGLTCPFAHRMQNPKGHAPVLDVLTAADVRLPDEVLSGPSHKTARGRKSQERRRSVRSKERLKKRKSRSLSISSPTQSAAASLPPMSPPFHSTSLNGHGKQSSVSANIQAPSVQASVEEQCELPDRSARESFVTATLRSMGGKAPPGFKNLPYPTIPEFRDSTTISGPSTPAQGFYADRDFVPYQHRRPDDSSRPEVEQEKTWMESRHRDLETLRRRKDERRKTGKGSISLSSVTSRLPASLRGASSSTNGGCEAESVSIDLSHIEFGAGSVESNPSKQSQRAGTGGKLLKSSRHFFAGRASTSTNGSYKETTSNGNRDHDDELDEFLETSVVSAGGFISVPSTVARRGGAVGRIKLPKSVQAAIDLDLKMDSAKMREVKAKKGKSHSISASMKNFWRGGAL